MSVRMVLKSTHSPKIHAGNTPYDFRVQLPRPLSLPGYWSVSLTEFTLKLSKSIPADKGPALYVCSDLCDDTVVGERELPLLRRAYTRKSTNITYKNPYEVPLRVGHFGDVHVNIRDDDNEPASFLTGEVTVTLVFKRHPFH